MINVKLLVAGLIGLGAAAGGIAAAGAGTAAPTHTSTAAQAAQPTGSATITVARDSVNGKTESILVNSQGLPLYTFAGDTSTRSAVTGQLAALWPPLISTAPTETGASGQVKVVSTANGSQVQYDGHFLYTFATDSPGHVTGQGVQNFSVATPSGASSPPPAQPKSAPSYSYGY